MVLFATVMLAVALVALFTVQNAVEAARPPIRVTNRYHDPLGADLGQVRILRTSPLVPVPPAC